MPSVTDAALARFAALPGAMGRHSRDASRFWFFLAPFRDVDDRVARLAAAARAEREARQAAMSAAPGQRRF